jgi:hypothetical protein
MDFYMSWFELRRSGKGRCLLWALIHLLTFLRCSEMKINIDSLPNCPVRMLFLLNRMHVLEAQMDYVHALGEIHYTYAFT